MKLRYWILLGILGIILSITGYQINRWWNWNFTYKALVLKELKPLIVQQALDIAESRSREEKLAQYSQSIENFIHKDLARKIKTIEKNGTDNAYAISVLTESIRSRK